MSKVKFQCSLEQDGDDETTEIESHWADSAAQEYAEYCFYNRDFWESGNGEWGDKICVHNPKTDETKFFSVEVESRPHFSVEEMDT